MANSQFAFDSGDEKCQTVTDTDFSRRIFLEVERDGGVNKRVVRAVGEGDGAQSLRPIAALPFVEYEKKKKSGEERVCHAEHTFIHVAVSETNA